MSFTKILLEVYRSRTKNLLCPQIQPVEIFRRPPILLVPPSAPATSYEVILSLQKSGHVRRIEELGVDHRDVTTPYV